MFCLLCQIHSPEFAATIMCHDFSHSLSDVFRPSIWILGYSYIYQAAQRAGCRADGQTLGFRNVNCSWRGFLGLRRAKVLQEMVEISLLSLGPLVLVLHVGCNNLC